MAIIVMMMVVIARYFNEIYTMNIWCGSTPNKSLFHKIKCAPHLEVGLIWSIFWYGKKLRQLSQYTDWLHARQLWFYSLQWWILTSGPRFATDYHHVQTSSGTSLASYRMTTKAVKWMEHEVNHLPSSKKEWRYAFFLMFRCFVCCCTEHGSFITACIHLDIQWQLWC